MNAQRVNSAQTDCSTGIICNQMVALVGHFTRKLPRTLKNNKIKRFQYWKDLGFYNKQYNAYKSDPCSTLQVPMAVRIFLQANKIAFKFNVLWKQIRKQ